MKPNFQTLNTLNDLLNKLSANFLPLGSEEAISVRWKLYVMLIWTTQLAYIGACIAGTFFVPREQWLMNSTLNFVVTIDIFVFFPNLFMHRGSLKKMIESLNKIFATEDEALVTMVNKTLAPLVIAMKVYVIFSVSAIFIWIILPLVERFHRDEFYCVDYQVPMALSPEPFSISVFVAGTILQTIGACITFLRKASLDFYAIHWTLVMAAQYKYMELKFISVFEEHSRSTDQDAIKREMRMITRHHRHVVRVAALLKRIFSPNVAVAYINNVLRFCFLCIMFIWTNDGFFAKFLVIIYGFGAMIQLYMLCYCIQLLVEASVEMMDSAFHSKWYNHDVSLQRSYVFMIIATKLKCQLSRFQNMNLTLSSFMSILNQAYSVSLLLLKSK